MMKSIFKPHRLQGLIKQAKTFPPVTVAVVDAGEEHVLIGTFEAADAGLIDPVLIGQRNKIEAILPT